MVAIFILTLGKIYNRFQPGLEKKLPLADQFYRGTDFSHSKDKTDIIPPPRMLLSG